MLQIISVLSVKVLYLLSQKRRNFFRTISKIFLQYIMNAHHLSSRKIRCSGIVVFESVTHLAVIKALVTSSAFVFSATA